MQEFVVLKTLGLRVSWWSFVVVRQRMGLPGVELDFPLVQDVAERVNLGHRYEGRVGGRDRGEGLLPMRISPPELRMSGRIVNSSASQGRI